MIFFPFLRPIIKLFPYWLLRALAIIMADVLRPFDWRTKAVMKNLRVIFPGISKRKLRELTRQTFRNFYLTYLNLLKINSYEEWKERVDLSELYRLKGKKCVIFSIHMGPWDVVASWVNEEGFNVYAIMERFPKIFRKIIEKYRKGIKIFAARDETLKLLRELRKEDSYFLVILIDRLTSGRGEKINFMGQEVTVPVGAFRIPEILGVDMYFAVSIWKKDKVVVEVKKIKKERALKETLMYFEDYLKKYPDQWYNFYFFIQRQT